MPATTPVIPLPLAAFRYRALLYLDTDVLVRSNLDHLLSAMLDDPTLAEMRSLAGCPTRRT